MTDTLSTEDFSRFCDFLQRASGIKLSENKQYLVSSRLNRLLDLNKIPSLKTLLETIQKPGQNILLQQVVDAMTTNETNWFRDEYPFKILVEKLLPEIAPNGGGRLWCAACSSGQEPFSIAMSLEENRHRMGGYNKHVEIIATDISHQILDQAKTGEYDSLAIARGLSSERKQRFFDNNDNVSRLKSNIRNKIKFSKLNLKENYAAMGKFDIIFCRNVLIYFSEELKRDIIQRLSKSLKPGGYLFLGASESASGFSDAFEMVRCNPGIVYKLKG